MSQFLFYVPGEEEARKGEERASSVICSVSADVPDLMSWLSIVARDDSVGQGRHGGHLGTFLFQDVADDAARLEAFGTFVTTRQLPTEDKNRLNSHWTDDDTYATLSKPGYLHGSRGLFLSGNLSCRRAGNS